MNYKIKPQIVNLLLDCIKSGRIRYKAAIVNQGSECFFIEHCNGIGKLIKEIPMYAVYVDRENNDTVCVVADDTDI